MRVKSLFQYQVYGLRILSDQVLLDLPLSSFEPEGADLRVFFGSSRVLESASNWTWETLAPLGLEKRKRLRLSQAQMPTGKFLLLDYKLRLGRLRALLNPSASQLELHFEGAFSETDRASFFLGSVMGFVLRRRGQTLLHGSAVRFHGSCFAFLGPKQAGKSTTTAALCQLEACEHITDDIAVVSVNQGQAFIAKGYPASRLNLDSIRSIDPKAAGRGTRVFSNRNKTYHFQNQGQENGTLTFPLERIYVLTEPRSEKFAVHTEKLTCALALRHLISNSYASYATLTREEKTLEFERISELARLVEVQALSIPRDLNRLGEFVEEVSRLLTGQ